MTALEISMELANKLQNKVGRSVRIFGGRIRNSDAAIFTSPTNKMLQFNNESYELSVENISDSVISNCTPQIAGNENNIFLIRDKQLFHYKYKVGVNYYNWEPWNELSFKNVLAITDYKECFACVGVTKSGGKHLFIFDPSLVPNFEDHTFKELNCDNSEDYYLKTVAGAHEKLSLVVSDNSSGKIYLSSESGRTSLIYRSKSKLICAISIASEDCLSLWFESGKVFFHYFSQLCSNNVVFLNKKVICVEKCFCNDSCFLWSSGGKLHHTEMSFKEGRIKMTNFIVEKNVVGVTSLVKFSNYILAHTINEALYDIKASSETRKEIVQKSGEVFSQIYNESLKIKEIQKDMEVSSEFLRFQEAIQNNKMDVELSNEDKFLIIKNKSRMTFKKEFWKIEIALFDREHRRVKIVELEADLVNETMVKVEHSFPHGKGTKVYLTGYYGLEIVSFCIGVINNMAPEKNTLKQMLDAFKLKNDLKINN